MINIFLELLNKVYNKDKKSNTGFKPKAWIQFRASIQNVYLGDKHIIIIKLRSKLDYIHIF